MNPVRLRRSGRVQTNENDGIYVDDRVNDSVIEGGGGSGSDTSQLLEVIQIVLLAVLAGFVLWTAISVHAISVDPHEVSVKITSDNITVTPAAAAPVDVNVTITSDNITVSSVGDVPLPGEWWGKFMTLNTTGLVDAVGDYSSAAAALQYRNNNTYNLYVYRLIITVADTGAFDTDFYGNSGVLTNGYEIIHRNSTNGIVHHLTDPDLNIRTNRDIASYMYDIRIDSFGTGDEILTARWSFDRAGVPIVLEPGSMIEVVLTDSYTFLTGHLFNLQGSR